MSLERKDIRAKLDPEVHEAMVAICERDGLDHGEFVEREIQRVVLDEMNKYMLSRSKFEDLGIIGKIRAKPGKG